jgi:hypothetical protein
MPTTPQEVSRSSNAANKHRRDSYGDADDGNVVAELKLEVRIDAIGGPTYRHEMRECRLLVADRRGCGAVLQEAASIVTGDTPSNVDITFLDYATSSRSGCVSQRLGAPRPKPGSAGRPAHGALFGGLLGHINGPVRARTN